MQRNKYEVHFDIKGLFISIKSVTDKTNLEKLTGVLSTVCNKEHRDRNEVCEGERNCSRDCTCTASNVIYRSMMSHIRNVTGKKWW
jgi:hypothetical protein